jgi:hypothetical protein
MKNFKIFSIICSLFLTSLVWAHGDEPHVLGTVTALGDDHVVITTPQGKSVSLAFHPEIVFQRNGMPVEHARPQIGDRLVADVSKKGVPDNRDWIATEINFATPKKNP